MKKLMAVPVLALGLMGAAPAAEANSDIFGEILTQILIANMGQQAGNDWHKYQPASSWHRDRHHVSSARLAPIVRDFERRTGGRVTDVELSRDGRFYVLRGYDRRGRPVHTRARLPQRYAGHQGWKQQHGYERHDDRRAFSHWRPGLERQHYSRFSHVVSHGDYYDVRARDRRGRPVALKVCSKTGKVLGRRYY